MNKHLGTILSWLGIGIAVMIMLTGYQVLRPDAISGSIGRTNERLAAIEGWFDRTEARLDIIDENLRAFRLDFDQARRRNTAAEPGPTDILGMAGVPMDEWYFTVRLKGRIYVLPRHETAAAQLRSAGFKKHRITPYLSGYKID